MATGAKRRRRTPTCIAAAPAVHVVAYLCVGGRKREATIQPEGSLTLSSSYGVSHPSTHAHTRTHTHTHTHTNAQGRRSLGPECIAKHRTIEGDQRNSLRKRGNYSIVMGRRDDRDDPAPAPAPAPAPVPPLAAFSLSCAASTLANMPLPKYEATVEKPSLLRSSYMSSKGSHW